jgi:uncharacterized protein (DUF1697 family)
MPSWVALLRGINVGSHNRVPMAGLRAVCEELGHEDVVTVIASGNVVFRSGSRKRAELERELERAVAREFGVKPAVMLRSCAEIGKLAAAHPFGKDASQSYVTFLAAKPTAAAVKELEAADIAPDRVKVVGTEVFLLHPNGLAGSNLSSAQVEKTLGVKGTNRNWRTVAKLAELCRTKG